MTATIHKLPKRKTESRYCSRCRKTESFVDRGDHLRCPTCRKRLERVEPKRRAS